MPTYRSILDTLRSEHRLRRIPPHRKDAGLIDLTSNDYMGLALRAGEWRDEFLDRYPDAAMTSSASRLLASDQQIYYELERQLERMYGRPALLFNSGYHANTGIVSALAIPGRLLVTDKLVHASIIDGVRLGKGECKRFAHNDISQLERILEKEHDHYERIIVICESVYSMDGDLAPLRQMAELKKRYANILLYVDEAHAIGAMGPRGAGLSAEQNVIEDIDILVGTFGKAVASQGAFAAVPEELKEYLINSARSFIFSTAIPPINAAWTLFMLEKLSCMDEERKRLAETGISFRREIERITGLENPSRSAIVPLMTGNAENALALSTALEKEGILALPIRRPTVPPGGERIRFSLTASLTQDDLLKVTAAIRTHYNSIL